MVQRYCTEIFLESLMTFMAWMIWGYPQWRKHPCLAKIMQVLISGLSGVVVPLGVKDWRLL